MEKTCYRCDAPISESATFCPACGAPQIRVSAQELTPLAPEPQAGEPAVTYSQPGPAFQPGAIRWKTFLRTTWPLAALAGVAASTIPLVGFFVLLPLSVLLGIWLYRRRQAAIIRASQGVKLGLAMGLISFISFAVLMVGAVSTSETLHQEMVRQITVAASRTPETQKMFLPWINTPQGFAVFMAILLAFTMFIFLAFTGITGAVAAATFGEKKP
jgi:ribosomal protein L40E